MDCMLIQQCFCDANVFDYPENDGLYADFQYKRHLTNHIFDEVDLNSVHVMYT